MTNQNDTDLMEEELLETMRLLEQSPEETMKQEEAHSEQSPTLSALEAARQPKVKTACETCPNSMWFSSPEEVKCYPRIMHMISWSGKDSNLITMCDGQFLN